MQRDSCRLLHTWIQKGSRTTSTTNTTSETTSEAASSLPAAARQVEGVFIASRRHLGATLLFFHPFLVVLPLSRLGYCGVAGLCGRCIGCGFAFAGECSRSFSLSLSLSMQKI